MKSRALKKKKRSNRRRREPLLRRAAHRVAVVSKAAVTLVLVAFIGYGSWWLYGKVITTPELAVTRLSVKGALRTQPREIIRLAGISEGQNIYSFSASEAARSIGESPWVLKAAVKRRLPGTVRIEIKERLPVAIVQMDGLFVMDSDGTIFKKLASHERLDLPLVTGLSKEMVENNGVLMTSFMRLFTVLEKRKGFNLDSVSEIHCDAHYGFTLHTLNRGLMVELGNSNFEAGLQLFERVGAMNREVFRGAVAVDVRRAGEVLVRYDHDVAKKGRRT
ncbi:MAG: cell division protein FtsQ/DivIB [Thermodesulfobacteriota bacterium]